MKIDLVPFRPSQSPFSFACDSLRRAGHLVTPADVIGLTRLPDQPVGERKFVPTVKQPTDIVITTRVKHG